MPYYANGAIPRSAMKEFRNTGKFGHPVFIDRLDAAFTAIERELGYKPYIASGQDIYRDITGQQYWKTYWTNLGRPGNAAAIGRSKHGLGCSADISGVPKTAAVVAIFKRFHIEFNYPPETWHVSDTSINTYADTKVFIQPPAPLTPALQAVVKNQQKRLNMWGAKLVEDGIPGPKFKAATVAFQKARGLFADGVIGPNTWALLVKDPPKKPAPAKPKPAPKPTGPVPPLLKGTDIKTVVKNQQTRLNVWRAATPPLKVDGIPGPRFKAATKVFQRARGIKDDGVIGPKTWALLLKNP